MRTSVFGRWWQGFVVLWLLACGLPARATHIRAGDIQATVDPNNLLRYTFTLHVFTDDNAPPGVDVPYADICFSDGTSLRVNRGGRVQLRNETHLNVFTFSHTFPNPGEYTVAYKENYRNGSIRNLANPAQLGFFVSSSVLIDATVGPITTVNMSNYPVDVANIGQLFTHSPGATVPVGDSLSFKFVRPRYGVGATNDCPAGPAANGVEILSYVSPGTFSQVPGLNTFTIDPLTGLIKWNVPGELGDFNFAFVCEQWRRVAPGIVRRVASVTRDMQVRVLNSTNLPPVPPQLLDTCVVAGSPFFRTIKATDPNGNHLALKASGRPLELGATFPRITGPSPLSGRFRWTPPCNSVRQEPYLVSFQAIDTLLPAGTPQLAQYVDWRVTVVGPPPQNLLATRVSGRRVDLTWNAYQCAGTADSLRIYRKDDSTGFVPQPCETGVPARLGYRYIGSVPASATGFTDTNGGRSFKRGTTYCYLIYATWPLPDGGASLASNESCVDMPGLLPQLTNATVDVTDTVAGQVTVRWTKGDPGPAPAVYVTSYRLARAEMINGSAGPYQLVRDNMGLSDTTVVDRDLNTQRRQYRYQLTFVTRNIADPQEEPIADTVQTATTPWLNALSTPAEVALTWQYSVPWDNSTRKHYIFRRINGTYTLIDSVRATTTGGQYTDRFTYQGLPRERVNCYHIETRGTYVIGTRDTAFTANFSQDTCAADRPCPPLLTLVPIDCAREEADCATSLANDLHWTPQITPPCSPALIGYNVYFQGPDSGAFTLLATTADTTYRHVIGTSRRGCYYVTAVDSSGLESTPSNTACQDNCQFLTLPNVITPDGDKLNDVFRPICASPLRRTTFSVYNRWGRKVYTSTGDPLINWGGVTDKGDRLADGVYYYWVEIEFDLTTPVTKTYKGWVQIAHSQEPTGTLR